MKTRRLLAFVVLLVPLLVLAQIQQAHYRVIDGVKLNDLSYTTGVVDPDMTLEKLCTTKWGKDVRHVTDAMKQQVCVAYGLVPHCYGRETNEIDHLVSRELAGKDEVANLWPQPYNEHPGAHEKDTVENWLHKQVCTNKMPLKQAQHDIALNWYEVYKQMKGGAK